MGIFKRNKRGKKRNGSAGKPSKEPPSEFGYYTNIRIKLPFLPSTDPKENEKRNAAKLEIEEAVMGVLLSRFGEQWPGMEAHIHTSLEDTETQIF
jgi:hypothetical protein